jgi:hypothetical protein
LLSFESNGKNILEPREGKGWILINWARTVSENLLFVTSENDNGIKIGM